MNILPMEAKLASEIPVGPQWQYEPKWDGFRCIATREGNTVELWSKAGQPLTRYFPEVVESLLKLTTEHFTLDGELIVPVNGRLSFDDLLQRIHPAASRVTTLSKSHPAQLITFDLLVDDNGKSLIGHPLSDRRKALEAFHAKYGVPMSKASTDLTMAQSGLTSMRGQLDGIVAKRLDEPYLSGERAMIKVKTMRSADCVVGGFRYASKGHVVGSLLLGLYDDQGLLNHVGFTSSIAAADRAALTEKLEKLIGLPGFTGAAPGGPSRWSTERSTEWQPLKTELVVEVQYDHFTARFRHGTKLLRWRPDKSPKQCTLEQVRYESTVSFTKLLAADS